MGQIQPRTSKSPDPDEEGIPGVGLAHGGDVEVQEPVFGSPIDNSSSFLGSGASGDLAAGVDNLALLDIPGILKPKPVQHRCIPIVFRWDSGGKEVLICGSFNHWATKIPMTNSHGDFTAIVELPEGRHEYKFFVDGQWLHDPSSEKSENGLGSYNNVMTVTKKDFDEYIETRELTSHEKE